MPTQHQINTIQQAYSALAAMLSENEWEARRQVKHTVFHTSVSHLEGGEELMDVLKNELGLNYQYQSWVREFIKFVHDTRTQSKAGQHPFYRKQPSKTSVTWDAMMRRRIYSTEKRMGIKTHEWQSHYADYLKAINQESGSPLSWLNTYKRFLPECFGGTAYATDDEYWSVTVEWLQIMAGMDMKRYKDETRGQRRQRTWAEDAREQYDFDTHCI